MLSKVRMNREGIAPGEMSPSRKGEYCGASLEVPRGVEFLETEGGRVGARQGQGRRGLGRRLRGQGGGRAPHALSCASGKRLRRRIAAVRIL